MMKQVTLFEALAEVEKAPTFSTIVSEGNRADCPPEPRFEPRQKQMKAVYEAMRHCGWMTLAEVAFHAHCPEASASARIRDLSNLQSIPHELRRSGNGLPQYRLHHA